MNPNDERMAVMEQIIEKNRIADEKYEKEMAENLEVEENERYEREFEKEDAEYQKEVEDEENRLESPEQVQALFSAHPDNGGYSDLWNHAPTRQKMLDEADLAIAAGEKNDDIRTYKKIAEKFRERKRRLKNGEVDENQINREDVFNQVAAMRHREMLIGNEYANSEQQEPETPEEIRLKFAMDNPDFTGEELGVAAKEVDETHKRQYVERGYSSNEYEIYRKAGEDAERERYLRERNQEE